MNRVRLTGKLICADAAEAALVESLLPAHIALTRAEPGCLSFEVTPTDDPLVWSVREQFSDAESFRRHQARVSQSDWGKQTIGINRDYFVEGLPR